MLLLTAPSKNICLLRRQGSSRIRNLAFATLYGGVRVEETTTIHFGEFFDPPPPSPSVLLDLIEEDLATRAPDALDRAVLDGCRQDIERG
jgi:hypothetical protein